MTRFERLLGAGLLAALIIVAAGVIFVVLPHHKRAHTAPGNTPFAATSIWNAPLAADAPIASDSHELVGQLLSQITEAKTWINTYSYSVPIYTVPRGQRRVPVTLDKSAASGSVAELAQTFKSGVPIPQGATQAPGSDGDLVVYQPSTNTMWELWIAHQVHGAWHAMWGGRMDHVSSNPGYFTSPPDWGTAATSLALMGGLIRISDLRTGRIDHALGISIPHARAGVVAAPAQRTDGNLASAAAIPEGTRFRLDPHLDIAKLDLPPLTRMLALAAQRYGIYVRDQSGCVCFYGEQSKAGEPNPYYGPRGIFATKDPGSLTAAFPWSRLEVVSAPLH